VIHKRTLSDVRLSAWVKPVNWVKADFWALDKGGMAAWWRLIWGKVGVLLFPGVYRATVIL